MGVHSGGRRMLLLGGGRGHRCGEGHDKRRPASWRASLGVRTPGPRSYRGRWSTGKLKRKTSVTSVPRLEVVAESRWDGPIEVRLDERSTQLPLGLADAVFVELADAPQA